MQFWCYNLNIYYKFRCIIFKKIFFWSMWSLNFAKLQWILINRVSITLQYNSNNIRSSDPLESISTDPTALNFFPCRFVIICIISDSSCLLHYYKYIDDFGLVLKSLEITEEINILNLHCLIQDSDLITWIKNFVFL